MRETEITEQVSRLSSFAENLGETTKKYQARLQGVISGELKDTDDKAKNPECSSKLGQELMNIHDKLCQSGRLLEELLNHIEL